VCSLFACVVLLVSSRATGVRAITVVLGDGTTHTIAVTVDTHAGFCPNSRALAVISPVGNQDFESSTCHVPVVFDDAGPDATPVDAGGDVITDAGADQSTDALLD
jgi:hypothetical protein